MFMVQMDSQEIRRLHRGCRRLCDEPKLLMTLLNMDGLSRHLLLSLFFCFMFMLVGIQVNVFFCGRTESFRYASALTADVRV
jgi:hypothetical protein